MSMESFKIISDSNNNTRSYVPQPQNLGCRQDIKKMTKTSEAVEFKSKEENLYIPKDSAISVNEDSLNLSSLDYVAPKERRKDVADLTDNNPYVPKTYNLLKSSIRRASNNFEEKQSDLLVEDIRQSNLNDSFKSDDSVYVAMFANKLKEDNINSKKLNNKSSNINKEVQILKNRSLTNKINNNTNKTNNTSNKEANQLLVNKKKYDNKNSNYHNINTNQQVYANSNTITINNNILKENNNSNINNKNGNYNIIINNNTMTHSNDVNNYNKAHDNNIILISNKNSTNTTNSNIINNQFNPYSQVFGYPSSNQPHNLSSMSTLNTVHQGINSINSINSNIPYPQDSSIKFINQQRHININSISNINNLNNINNSNMLSNKMNNNQISSYYSDPNLYKQLNPIPLISMNGSNIQNYNNVNINNNSSNIINQQGTYMISQNNNVNSFYNNTQTSNSVVFNSQQNHNITNPLVTQFLNHNFPQTQVINQQVNTSNNNYNSFNNIPVQMRLNNMNQYNNVLPNSINTTYLPTYSKSSYVVTTNPINLTNNNPNVNINSNNNFLLNTENIVMFNQTNQNKSNVINDSYINNQRQAIEQTTHKNKSQVVFYDNISSSEDQDEENHLDFKQDFKVAKQYNSSHNITVKNSNNKLNSQKSNLSSYSSRVDSSKTVKLEDNTENISKTKTINNNNYKYESNKSGFSTNSQHSGVGKNTTNSLFLSNKSIENKQKSMLSETKYNTNITMTTGNLTNVANNTNNTNNVINNSNNNSEVAKIDFIYIKNLVSKNEVKELFKYLNTNNSFSKKENSNNLTNFIFSINTQNPYQNSLFKKLFMMLRSNFTELSLNKEHFPIVKALLLKSEYTELSVFWSIFKTKFSVMAYNQQGSIVLQHCFKLVNTNNMYKERNEFWNEIKSSFVKLSCHHFGVHLVKSVLMLLGKENNLSYFYSVEQNFFELITNCYGVTMIKLCFMVISPKRFASYKNRNNEYEGKKYSNNSNSEIKNDYDDVSLTDIISSYDKLKLDSELINNDNAKTKKSNIKNNNNNKNKKLKEDSDDENNSFNDFFDSSIDNINSEEFKGFIRYSEQMRKRLMNIIVSNFDSIIYNKYGHYGILFLVRSWGANECLDFFYVMLNNIENYLVYSYPLKIIKRVLSDMESVRSLILIIPFIHIILV